MNKIKILAVALGMLALFVFGCGDNQNPTESSDVTFYSPPNLQLITLPDGAVLTSATFGVYVNDMTGGTTHHVNIHRITAPWDEHTVTWNSFAGSYDPTIIATMNILGVGWYTADITSLVQDWLDGVYPDYGILIEQAEDRFTRYSSSEYGVAALHPYLEICYTVDGNPFCDTIQRGFFGEVADAVIQEIYPNTNAGNSDLLYTLNVNGLDKQSMFKFDVEFEPEPPDSTDVQLTPTGTDCCDFVDGTAQDLILTVNPRGKIAPGGFFLFNLIQETGDVTVEVSMSVNPPGEPLPSLEDAKVFILVDGDCQNISNQPGVIISYVGGVATIFVPEVYVNASQDNTLITKVHYKPPTGQAGTEFCFDTEVNGAPESQICITVIPQ
jgi:hypothetical protein